MSARAVVSAARADVRHDTSKALNYLLSELEPELLESPDPEG